VTAPSAPREELSIHEVAARAAGLWGELATTYVSRGACIVGRLRDVTELSKESPYQDVVIFGRARTFLEAFEIAERRLRDNTPDWVLDALEGHP
jgi:hypothetical protein